MTRVLLISPPWRTPEDADLGLATLEPLLRRASIAADLLHGTLQFPYSDTNFLLRGLYTSFYFTPHLYPEVTHEEAVRAAVDAYLNDNSMEGLRVPLEEVSFESLQLGSRDFHERDAASDIVRAGICVERCVERALASPYEVYGFSCTFELQLLGGLAIARRLKEARPDARIVFGGAACFGETGDALVRGFGFLDAVCHCEGDDVIVPLVTTLLEAGDLADVPGIAYRDPSGQVQRNAPPPLVVDLDRLPMPNFDPFTRQLAESEWSHRPLRLYFETSRGCWWGQKHLCTFCGLNAEGLTYRRKSPERAYDEIAWLHERYPATFRMHATDNILDMGYLRTVMPRLAELRQHSARPLRMFWEIKSCLDREQVRVLRDAGTDYVQPGIESFSDDVLALMLKGASGLGQVRHLKYLSEHRIEPSYQVIVRNPGEQAEHYREMCALIPYIDHLPPPRVVTMELQRFSPYFNAPEAHGIRNVAPKSHYGFLYRGPDVDLEALAYCFDYEHDMHADTELTAAARRFVTEAVDWYQRFESGRAYHVRFATHTQVLDRRAGGAGRGLLAGRAHAVYHFLDQPRGARAMGRELSDLEADVGTALLDTWFARRWVCQDKRGRVIAVLPHRPHDPQPATPRDRLTA